MVLLKILNDSVLTQRISSRTGTADRVQHEMSGSQEIAIRREIADKGFYVFTDQTGRSFKLERNENGANNGEPAAVW
jgi:hypothetical protein